MNLDNIKIRTDKYYSVGYCEKLDKYVVSITVPWIMYYDRFYEISLEEYNMFGTEELDNLIDKIRSEETNSSRFLFSEKNEENNEEQLLLRNKVREN